jgi:hypothetical protein
VIFLDFTEQMFRTGVFNRTSYPDNKARVLCIATFVIKSRPETIYWTEVDIENDELYRQVVHIDGRDYFVGYQGEDPGPKQVILSSKINPKIQDLLALRTKFTILHPEKEAVIDAWVLGNVPDELLKAYRDVRCRIRSDFLVRCPPDNYQKILAASQKRRKR